MAVRGPIYGGELVAVIQGGLLVWANRDQVKAILAAQDMNPAKPANNTWIKPVGDELFAAIQGGELVQFTVADLNAWLATTTTNFEVSAGAGRLTNITGSEFVPVSSGGDFGLLDVGDAASMAVGGELLPYTSVLFIDGDSQARGTASAADQAAAVAAYVPDPLVFTYNASRQWVQYLPGTITGLNSLANTGNVGAEIGFIRRFRAKYPTEPLYVVKSAAAGSFQARNPTPLQTSAVVSIAGNILTVVSGSIARGQLLVGTGIPAGIYVSLNAAGGQFYVSRLGGTSNPNLSVSNVTVSTYDIYSSWGPDDGSMFNGHSGSITNATRGLLLDAIAAISTGKPVKMVANITLLGTNDKSSPISAAAFSAAASGYIAQKRAALPMTETKVILGRVMNPGQAAVRAAQEAIASSDALVYLINNDQRSIWDGTHWDMTSLDGIGSDAFEITFNGAAGI